MSRNIKKTVHPELGRRVFVGLSGGVDSSVAALLLKNEGYKVIGAFIKSYNVDGCEEEDAEYARRVAEKLGIPFYIFDMREEYFSRVVAEMIDGYRRGITPNPDVLCNREIKFGLFWERAKALGADYIATGHYISTRITNKYQYTKSGNSYIRKKLVIRRLCAAKDTNKDQSYFLWKLTQDDLSHCLFPIGDYTKPEVRKIAKKAGLPTAERKDSQGICFLGKVKLPDFLKKYIAPKKGKIVDTEGKVIGEHDGAQFCTIGQRHGIGIGKIPLRRPKGIGAPTASVGVGQRHIGAQIKDKRRKTKEERSKIKDREPFYVAGKDVKKNILIVAEGENHPALYKKEIELAEVNFVIPEVISLIRANGRIVVFARVRYRQPLASATLYKIPDTEYYKLLFNDPQKFIAPGQSAVFYRISDSPEPVEGYELLGGGVIL